MWYGVVTNIPVQKVGGNLKLNEAATIRTGAVIGRKAATESTAAFRYPMLNLKCIEADGSIDRKQLLDHYAKERLKAEYLTRKGDVLIRLSAPYTAVLIDKKELCGLLVPSHFAILRVGERILPEYLLWFLRRESTLQQIVQNSSGSTVLGTISSGFIGSLTIRDLPIKKQRALGQLLLLSGREQELLARLAKAKALYHRETLNIIYDKFKGEN